MERHQGTLTGIKQRLRPQTILIIVSLLILVLPGLVHSTPSGQTWSVEGGGFCNGTYTVYNNTVGTTGLYAQNCGTGVNDCFNASDLGALWNSCLRAKMPQGGSVWFRNGYFAVVTSIIWTTCGTASYCQPAYSWIGSGYTFPDGKNDIVNLFNATTLVAKSDRFTMIEATAQSPSVTCTTSTCSGAGHVEDNYIGHMGLDSNGHNGVTGIDFRMFEAGSAYNTFDTLAFTGGNSTNFAFQTGLLLDGNEDSLVINSIFQGESNVVFNGNALDIQWQTPPGDVHLVHDVLKGYTNLAMETQQASIVDSVLNSVKLLQTPTLGTVLSIENSYLANLIGTGIIQLNGQTLSTLSIHGSAVRTSSTVPFITGAGTITASDYSDSTWIFGASSNWNTGGATLSFQSSCGVLSGTQAHCNTVVSGSAPTNFPFTIASSTF